jgi:hypothetical protein
MKFLVRLLLRLKNKLFAEFELIEETKHTTSYVQLIVVRMNYNFYKQFPLYYDLVSYMEANPGC